MISPDVLMVFPRCTEHPQCTHDIPLCTAYPRCTHDIPRCTHDIPRCTHDIPRCTECPPMYWTHIIQGGNVPRITENFLRHHVVRFLILLIKFLNCCCCSIMCQIFVIQVSLLSSERLELDSCVYVIKGRTSWFSGGYGIFEKYFRPPDLRSLYIGLLKNFRKIFPPHKNSKPPEDQLVCS